MRKITPCLWFDGQAEEAMDVPLGPEIGNAIGAEFLSRAFFDDFGRSEAMSLAVGARDFGSFAYPGADKVAVAFTLCLDAKLIEWGAGKSRFGVVIAQESPGHAPSHGQRHFGASGAAACTHAAAKRV